MRKFLSLFAAALLTLTASATIRNITPTHCFEGDRADGYTLYVELARGAQAGDTIVLADGTYIEPLTFPVNVPVVVMAAEGAKPLVKQSGYFQIHASAEFKGIKFQFVGETGNGYCMYLYDNTSKYLKLEGCEFQDFTQYCVSSWEDYHMDSVIVNNCYFHNLAKGPFYFKASGRADLSNTCDKLVVTNTTFNDIDINGYVSVIDFRNNDGSSWVGNANELLVDHCTFYNIHGEYNRIIMSYKSANTMVSNCIIAQPTANEFYPTYNYGGEVKNNLSYNTKSHRSGPTLTDNITGNPLFVDAANGDFTLATGSPALTAATDGGAIGDPRWIPSAEPTLENGFYLIGKINGVEGWTAADLSADRKFAANPENPAEFMVSATLAEGDEIKVVNVVNDAITAWYPAEGGNYVIDAAHAGEKTIYFQPDYKADWVDFGGYFYIAANEEPAVDFTKPFTLKFNGNGSSDNSNSFTIESGVAAIFDEASAPYVSALNTVSNVYSARTIADDPSSLKFGTSSKKGTLAFTIGQAIEVDSIIVNATQYGNNAAEVTVNGTKFDLTQGNKVPTDCKLTPEGEVSTITIAQTGSERIYLRYVKVYPKQAGEEPAKFYITGDSALVVNNGLDKAKAWNPDAIKSETVSYKMNLAAGDYKLKVTVDGTWETAKGFNDMTYTADGLTADGDGNICFTLAEAGEVSVHYDSEAFFLNGNFYVAPVEVKYYLKNNWGGEEWTWKEMQEDGYGAYMLANVVVGGDGVNLNSAASDDEGSKWITWAEITAYDASYEPATIGALDTVVFMFDPEEVNTYTGANGLSAVILGKYVAPAEEIKYCELATGHLSNAEFGDVNGRILLTIQKIADSNNLRVAIKNNTAAGNTKTGLNYLWVNATGAKNNNATYGSHEAEDVEEVSVIVEFDEAQESYVFNNIHWAYAGWGGEWAIDGLTVSAAELCEASTPIVEVTYYMKNNWDAGADWTWKAMTKDGENYKLENVVFGGTGVNYNTAESDEGSSWVPVANIAGDAISAKDTVTLVLDPAAGTVTATLIGKYVDPNPGEHTYTVAGSSDVAFGTAWDPTNAHNDMVLNGVGIYLWEKTELTLPEGTIKFKVCEDHAWDVAYPAQDYELAIPETGVYSIYISFNPETKEVNATATKTGDATVTVDYYLVGSAKGWEAKAENIFTLNAEAGEGIEEYKIETTLEVGEGLKVLSSTGVWYPDGMGNEYVVDQDHAGATTIYFRPAGNAEWAAFGGYMYVVPTGGAGIDAVDANAPAVKVLHNGQILIKKGDKTYNIMGAIVR